jgi:hypothetical protein
LAWRGGGRLRDSDVVALGFKIAKFGADVMSASLS